MVTVVVMMVMPWTRWLLGTVRREGAAMVMMMIVVGMVDAGDGAVGEEH